MKPIVYIIASCMLFLCACDPNRLFDENKNIEESGWFYKTKLPYYLQIKDTSKYYNVLVNLRVDADYQYSNIFMLVHTTNPEKKTDQRRIEIKLADESGRWMGNGLGDLYDYQFPAFKKVKFPQAGFYRFELEQNMRDDTLLHVKAAGIRIEEFVEE